MNKYKNIYNATNPTAPYVVIEAASGAHISHHQSYVEARTAMRQYETATTTPMPMRMPENDDTSFTSFADAPPQTQIKAWSNAIAENQSKDSPDRSQDLRHSHKKSPAIELLPKMPILSCKWHQCESCG